MRQALKTPLSEAFQHYVERAREGRTSLWRFALGIVVITLVWGLTTTLALNAGIRMSGTAGLLIGEGREGSWAIVQRFFQTPTGLAATLSSFLGISVGVYLVVKVLHRRAFGGVLGASGRLSASAFLRGFVASLIASALAELAFYFIDPSLTRSSMATAVWLGWLLPLAALLFVQISAEELAFRGYLMQSLAARFRSPFVWGVVPGLLFTLLHWNSDSPLSMNESQIVTIAAFAAIAALLVYLTGNLGAAMGTHFGMNLFSILIVSHMGWLSGAALFVSRPLDAPGWTGVESLWLAVINIASFALILAMLLHRRSPLRVIGAGAAGATTPLEGGAQQDF